MESRYKSYKSYKSWLSTHLFKNWPVFIAVIGSIVVMTVMKTFIPIIIGDFINNIIATSQVTKLITLLLIILTLYFSTTAMDYISMITGHYLGLTTEKNMRKEFFDIIQYKSLKFHDNAKVGDLQALATNDLRTVNAMISHGSFYVYPFVYALIVTIFLIDLLNLILGLILIPFVIIYIYTILYYRKSIAPYVAAKVQKHSDLSVVLQDNITGASVVKTFVAIKKERKKFHKAVNAFRDVWIGENNVQSKYYPMLVLYITIGTMFIISCYLVAQNMLSIGTLVSINLILATLIDPTNTLYWATKDMMIGFAACRRVFRNLSKEKSEGVGENLENVPNRFNGEIIFKNVSFSYGNSSENYPNVLNNLSFKIKPKEKISLVGPTGCGKSTLAKLILSLYKPQKGEILLDGKDINTFEPEVLRKHIGYVEQDTYLFPRSIKENIRFGKPEASNKEILHASKLAQVDDFVKNLQKGYDTIVGERGTRLSGGEKQRVSIARALLTDPEIIILDDSVSAVDSETEKKIGKAINNVLKERTTIIITHRLKTIINSDKILVLRKGQIVAEGTHEELIRSSVDYRRIFGKHINLPEMELEIGVGD
ncbi:MAG: ABC transporter ATP-binding protein [Candidatus Lokiarchaeota archaeon]